MKIPGFAAETTLYRSAGCYRAQGQFPDAEGRIVASAVHWGSIGDDGCVINIVGQPIHQYSAILWGIPWGQSWDWWCHNTLGPAGTPVAGLPPANCVNNGINEWGQWGVPDPCCQCTAAGKVC
jgi:hypothetical protein